MRGAGAGMRILAEGRGEKRGTWATMSSFPMQGKKEYGESLPAFDERKLQDSSRVIPGRKNSPIVFRRIQKEKKPRG